MIRLASNFALAVALASVPCAQAALAATAPPTFSDDACPEANGPGRALNAIDPASPGANDKLTAAAQGLADAYRDCVKTYDNDASGGHNLDQSSDYITVHRAYARLQLARSLQRVAYFAAQLGDPQKARANYDDAVATLDGIASVIGNANTAGEGSEGKLMAESKTLREQIVAAEQALSTANASNASPAPGPAPSVAPSPKT